MTRSDITWNTYENIKLAAEEILQKIAIILQDKEQAVIAIDGRCGAGKTTLAQCLMHLCDCNIVPMDHFFLRPGQRSAERLAQPGGNVDYERFEEEVLKPLKEGRTFSYCPYDCREQKLTAARAILPKRVTVIEGSYSCHPKLEMYYDLKVFLTVDEEEQLRRIKKRNGQDGLIMFRGKWIPLEEKYFSVCQTGERCDMQYNTGKAENVTVGKKLT